MSVRAIVRGALCVVFSGLLLAPTLRADELSGAYAAILRGDVDAGIARLKELQAANQGTSKNELTRVSGWLDHYRSLVTSRDDIRQKTFDWNVEQAKAEIAKGGEGKLYLAMMFAARAMSYAADEKAFAREPWIEELCSKAAIEADKFEKAADWGKAHAYYLALERIQGEKSRFHPLREEAARHLRVDVLYEDREALDRRIVDVATPVLHDALKVINDRYFERPDFKKVAEGGLKYLHTLAESKKLRGYLDGLKNDEARKQFIEKLDQIAAEVPKQERFMARDVRELFDKVRELNDATVRIPEGLLVVEFLDGALEQLDAYTSIIWPADATDFDKMMLGGFEGVGIQLGIDEDSGRLKVTTPLEGSPALEGGVQPDDLIVEVDGKTTKGWSTDDAVRNIMGPSGTKVVLTMYRPSTGERIPFELTRRNIVIRTVRGYERVPGTRGDEWNYLIDPKEGIAYIRLVGFHPESDGELRNALSEARKQGMKALVLDVRYNPGGLLDTAVDIVSAFLREGEVVSTRGRVQAEHQQTKSSGNTPEGSTPLVVLVNEASASASEILAGALQDHQRAIVIGQRSFGKGSVQRVFPLGRSPARLKLTTAIYYLPNGRSPHKAPDAEVWGVDPDQEVKATPKEEREIIRRQNQAIVINNGRTATSKPALSAAALKELKDDEKKKKGDGEEDEELDTPLLADADIERLNADPHPAAEFDPQLEMALLQLRVKLAGRMPWPAKIAAAPEKARGG